MKAELIEEHDANYISLISSDFNLGNESELNELLSLCYEFASSQILLGTKNLSSTFFDLKSGLAGLSMQKFANYQARVAVIVSSEIKQTERFKELVYEMNKGNSFRFFNHEEEAVSWLTSH